MRRRNRTGERGHYNVKGYARCGWGDNVPTVKTRQLLKKEDRKLLAEALDKQ